MALASAIRTRRAGYAVGPDATRRKQTRASALQNREPHSGEFAPLTGGANRRILAVVLPVMLPATLPEAVPMLPAFVLVSVSAYIHFRSARSFPGG